MRKITLNKRRNSLAHPLLGVSPTLQVADECNIGVTGVIQRSHSNQWQQHIRPRLEIKTFNKGSESERIFSISWYLVGENWYKPPSEYQFITLSRGKNNFDQSCLNLDCWDSVLYLDVIIHFNFIFIYKNKTLFVADIIEWEMVTEILEIMKCFRSVPNVLSLRELTTDWRCPSVQFLGFRGCKKPEWNLWCFEKKTQRRRRRLCWPGEEEDII